MHEEATISARSIGIFGGTFDPVHSGHLALARLVRDRLALERLVVVPARRPPHKRQPVASFAHRLAMLDLALAECDGCERIESSPIEGELPVPSYTIRTVEALMHRLRAQRFCLVIGMDSLPDLPRWHRAAELLTRIDLAVVNRNQPTPARIRELVEALQPKYHRLPHREGVWVNQAGKSLQILTDFHQPFSSSALRAALGQGQPVIQGLSPAVLAHIRTHGLYQDPTP